MPNIFSQNRSRLWKSFGGVFQNFTRVLGFENVILKILLILVILYFWSVHVKIIDEEHVASFQKIIVIRKFLKNVRKESVMTWSNG